MFSQEPRCIYQKNQLGEVICQLRFPDILSISTQPPAEFQEAIRQDYPLYSKSLDAHPPQIIGGPGNYQLQSSSGDINHQFTTLDGIWRINLTSRFLSLTTSRYTRWEEFARRLDKPLVSLIQIYHPRCFERMGLRYLNFVSRHALELDGTPFRELFATPYLGLMGEDGVDERSLSRCCTDADVGLTGGARAKIHAGPGRVTKSGPEDTEVKFIFDQDVYILGNLPVNRTAGVLETLHTQADSIFRGAITQSLHEAMEPDIV